jgi:hypothetical protein
MVSHRPPCSLQRIGHTVNARGLPYYIDMEERDYSDYSLCTDGILQIYKDLLYIV